MKKGDWVRNNLENVHELEILIKKYCKDILGLRINIAAIVNNFGMQSTITIEKRLGWSGMINGKIFRKTGESRYKKEICGVNVHSIFEDDSHIFGNEAYFGPIITGINPGSGSYGSDFSFDFKLFMNDFPKLKNQYKLWTNLDNKDDIYNKKRDDYGAKLIKLHNKICNDSSVIKNIKKERGAIQNKLDAWDDKQYKYMKDLMIIAKSKINHPIKRYDSVKLRTLSERLYQ